MKEKHFNDHKSSIPETSDQKNSNIKTQNKNFNASSTYKKLKNPQKCFISSEWILTKSVECVPNLRNENVCQE